MKEIFNISVNFNKNKIFSIIFILKLYLVNLEKEKSGTELHKNNENLD